MTSRQSGPVRHSATEKMLKERRAHYFMDQQVSLHGTIVSIALGVAGLAAASLFKVQSSDRPYHLLFWLLWVTSILAVAAVYSGVTVNVYAAPSSIPGPLDMFLPFGIALLEFMLFTVLTTPLINQLDPRTIVVVWFSCFAAFGAVTTTVLARVRWLFEHTDYGSKSLQNAVSNMSKKMAADQAASASPD